MKNILSEELPVVWAFSGFDGSGGAGAQADMRAIESGGAHACAIITALTAQNSEGASLLHVAKRRDLREQVGKLRTEFPPRAIKLGMLAEAEVIEWLSEGLLPAGVPVICDPVLRSSSGSELLDPQGLRALKRLLFPRVSLLTPNLSEAEALSGQTIKTPNDVENAARQILSQGPKAVLIKGGHGGGPTSQDYYLSSVHSTSCWVSSHRQNHSARGTGCALSSLIAAGVACGLGELDAVVMARTKLSAALRDAKKVGKMRVLSWAKSLGPGPEDLPWVTDGFFNISENRTRFAPASELGFYPIVDRSSWLTRLLPLGVKTIQLRVKDLSGYALEKEIEKAVGIAREHRCKIFINDFWEMAIKYRAYGVHLGQEDVPGARLQEIEKAGLRLGISTHCYSEVARAHAIRPSYIAIGPIYPTTLKTMKFEPQGVDAIRVWRSLLTYPLVAIGGITLERAKGVMQAGADSIAVVSDVLGSKDPEARTRAWLDASVGDTPGCR